MTRTSLSDLERSVVSGVPPEDLAPAVAALWWAAKGDWQKAHGIVMGEAGGDAAWVHAYLHRLEGDGDNAAYWYRQARRPVATGAHDASGTQSPPRCSATRRECADAPRRLPRPAACSICWRKPADEQARPRRVLDQGLGR